MQDIFFIHSFGEGLLGWPHFPSVEVNSAAVKTVVQVFLLCPLCAYICFLLE